MFNLWLNRIEPNPSYHESNSKHLQGYKSYISDFAIFFPQFLCVSFSQYRCVSSVTYVHNVGLIIHNRLNFAPTVFYQMAQELLRKVLDTVYYDLNQYSYHFFMKI